MFFALPKKEDAGAGSAEWPCFPENLIPQNVFID